MAEFRIEHDSMGEVRVPARAKWRAQTQRAVQNFPISGQPVERELIRGLALIKGFGARVRAERGLLDADKAAEHSISMAAQTQVGAFLAVGGIFTPDPNWFLQGPFAGHTLFQIPSTLPEKLNFIQIHP